MPSIITFFNANKPYFVALLTAVAAGLQALGSPIPAFVYTLLAAAGITVVHSSIQAAAKVAATNAVAEVEAAKLAATAKPAAKK